MPRGKKVPKEDLDDLIQASEIGVDSDAAVALRAANDAKPVSRGDGPPAPAAVDPGF